MTAAKEQGLGVRAPADGASPERGAREPEAQRGEEHGEHHGVERDGQGEQEPA